MTSIYGFYTTFSFILNNFFYNNADGPIGKIFPEKNMKKHTQKTWNACSLGGHQFLLFRAIVLKKIMIKVKDSSAQETKENKHLRSFII